MITKENAKQWLPLVQAMAEGKTIQVRGDLGGWFDVVSGCLTELRDGVARYRIKPEPKLRPWKAEEAPKMIVMRDKRDAREQSRIYELQPGGFYRGLKHPHDWTLYAVSEFCVRLLEDGTEHPCGVLCEGEEHGEA